MKYSHQETPCTVYATDARQVSLKIRTQGNITLPCCLRCAYTFEMLLQNDYRPRWSLWIDRPASFDNAPCQIVPLVLVDVSHQQLSQSYLTQSLKKNWNTEPDMHGQKCDPSNVQTAHANENKRRKENARCRWTVNRVSRSRYKRVWVH